MSATTVAPRHESVIAAFSEVAEVLAEGVELDGILHLIVEKLCALAGVRRCSIHLRDDRSGLFHGRVGHADRDIDADVQRMVAGTPADGITRELIKTRRPVLLTNALADPRAIRSTMRYWKVRSLLAVPMVLRDEVIGLIFLDNMEEPHDYSPAQQQLAATFANLAATAVAQVKLTSELRESLATVTRQNALLKRAAAMEERLTELLLRGSGVRKIAEAITALTRRPSVVYDADFRALEQVPGETGAPCVLDERARAVPAIAHTLAALRDGRPRIVHPVAGSGLAHRVLIAPVRVQGRVWGHLSLVERGARLGPLDEKLARRAAATIALEVGATHREAEVDWQARESLAGALIRGEEDAGALRRRADLLGVRLEAPRLLVLVRGPQSTPSLARALAAALDEETPPQGVLATGVAGGAALIVPLPPGAGAGVEWARRRVAEALHAAAPHGALLAALSSRCTRAEELVRAHAEAEQVLRCLEEHVRAPGHQLLAAEDLGAGGRAFLATTSGPQARRFVQSTLGEVLEHEDLLHTLAAFFENAQAVRRTAACLGVHENTVRYRLSRVRDLTGLAVCEDPNAQLSAQLCLLTLRLQDGGVWTSPNGARAPAPATV
ncbi:MAG TPA: GAF domain-containing protein [Solirubrobacteraceae bacterium]|jgi:sugar diacid utilization regulator|nr:GAF domain-containing protein [Solirubrobacteraceae bacterium]